MKLVEVVWPEIGTCVFASLRHAGLYLFVGGLRGRGGWLSDELATFAAVERDSRHPFQLAIESVATKAEIARASVRNSLKTRSKRGYSISSGANGAISRVISFRPMLASGSLVVSGSGEPWGARHTSWSLTNCTR